MQCTDTWTAYQSIQMSAHVDTNDRLSDLQVSQALSAFSSSFRDPYEGYQRQLLLRKRRAVGIATGAQTNEFWMSADLKHFATSHDSGMVIVRGPFSLRSAIKDFGIDAIRALIRSNIPTVWALEGVDKEQASWSSTDLLKYLTWQALGKCSLTEKQMSMRYSRFQTAQTPNEWMTFFKEVVQYIGGQLYLVVDLAAIQASLISADGFNIIRELGEMIAEKREEIATMLKIIIISYDTDWSRISPSEIYGSIIPVKRAVSRKPPRRQNRNFKFTKL